MFNNTKLKWQNKKTKHIKMVKQRKEANPTYKNPRKEGIVNKKIFWIATWFWLYLSTQSPCFPEYIPFLFETTPSSPFTTSTYSTLPSQRHIQLNFAWFHHPSIPNLDTYIQLKSNSQVIPRKFFEPCFKEVKKM